MQEGPPEREWVFEALATARAAAWRWDAGRGRLDVTDGAVEILGSMPAMLRDLEALVHPGDRARRHAALARALRRGEAWECSFRVGSGEAARWVEERGRSAVEGDGRSRSAVALLVDVTRRKEAEETLQQRLGSESRERHAAQAATGMAESALRALARSESHLESIFSSMADGLVLFDAEGRITRMNPSAREMLRFGDEEAALSTAERMKRVRVLDARGEVVPHEALPVVVALRGVSSRGQTICLELAGGRRVWAVVGAAPILGPDGAVVGAVLTLGDVSRIHEMQEEREDLSRMMAHDLRTPLSVILGQAKLLGRRNEGLEGVRARAETIVTSGQRMSAMLNDLLESTLLESGRLKLELQPVDVPALVRDLRKRLIATHHGERIDLVAAGDVPPAHADPGRLERVLLNLMTNALKYSPSGSPVTVRVTREGAWLEVAVEDRGQGIPAEDMPRLFERYFRALGSARFEGMGLGLFTARKLVEAHGGTISASSVHGEGSVFRVRLPVALG